MLLQRHSIQFNFIFNFIEVGGLANPPQEYFSQIWLQVREKNKKKMWNKTKQKKLKEYTYKIK
jgi:hypothetical protein